MKTTTLSNRQMQVVSLLSQGLTYKQIGAELGISHTTVSEHICAAMERKRRAGAVNMKNQMHLVNWVMQHGR